MTVPGDLATLRKAEIHVHLEGTVRPATLEELCARTGIGVPRAFADLPSFVAAYSCAWATMTTPGDYARLVRDLPLEIGWVMLEAARGVPEVVAIGLGGPEEGF